MRAAVPVGIARRYWQRNWLRALLMVAGLIMGVTLLLSVLLVNDSLSRTYDGWERGLQGWAEIEVRAAGSDGLPGSLTEAVRASPGVGAAAPVLDNRSHLFVGEARLAVHVRGVDPAAEARLRPFAILAGRPLEAGDAQAALLSYAAAVELDARPGSDVSLLTPQGVELLRVVGIYRPLSDDPVQERVLQLPLEQAQSLFSGGRDTVTRIDVATDGTAASNVKAALRELVPVPAAVVESAGGAVEMRASSNTLRAALLLAGLLAILAAGVLIAVHVRAVMEERATDLKLLRGLGVAPWRVRLWLGAEVGVVVVVAVVPALLLAAPAASWLLRHVPSELLPFAASVAAPRLGASVLPAPVFGALLGALAVLLGVRLLLAGLLRGLARAALYRWRSRAVLRLAGHFLGRRIGPSATVAGALLLTSAGLIGVQGAAEVNRKSTASWLDEAVMWDLMVATAPGDSGVSVPLPLAAVEQLSDLPGVDAVSAQRQVAVTSRGETLTMIALGGYDLDGGRRLSVVQAADLSGSSMWWTLSQGQGVALSVPLADRLAVSVGDRLPLTTQGGEREFTVVALVDDVSSRSEAAYIALDDYAAIWGDHGVDSVAVRLTPGADAVALPEVTSLDLPQQGTKIPVHVTLAASYRSDLLAAATDSYRAAGTMALVALLIALLALVANSLATAWQAEGEMQGLRAMGVPRVRLVLVFIVNLSLTAGAGVLPGMVLGTLLSRRLVGGLTDAGPLTWNWPTDAYGAVTLLLVVTVMLAAALLVAARPRAGSARG